MSLMDVFSDGVSQGIVRAAIVVSGVVGVATELTGCASRGVLGAVVTRETHQMRRDAARGGAHCTSDAVVSIIEGTVGAMIPNRRPRVDPNSPCAVMPVPQRGGNRSQFQSDFQMGMVDDGTSTSFLLSGDEAAQCVAPLVEVEDGVVVVTPSSAPERDCSPS